MNKKKVFKALATAIKPVNLINLRPKFKKDKQIKIREKKQ